MKNHFLKDAVVVHSSYQSLTDDWGCFIWLVQPWQKKIRILKIVSHRTVSGERVN